MNMSKIALVSGVGLVALFGSIATADDSGLSPNDFSEATKGLHEKYYLTIEPSDVSRAEPSSEGAFAGIDETNIFEYLRALTDISLESADLFGFWDSRLSTQNQIDPLFWDNSRHRPVKTDG